jgi:hypothetical protein
VHSSVLNADEVQQVVAQTEYINTLSARNQHCCLVDISTPSSVLKTAFRYVNASKLLRINHKHYSYFVTHGSMLNTGEGQLVVAQTEDTDILLRVYKALLSSGQDNSQQHVDRGLQVGEGQQVVAQTEDTDTI